MILRAVVVMLLLARGPGVCGRRRRLGRVVVRDDVALTAAAVGAAFGRPDAGTLRAATPARRRVDSRRGEGSRVRRRIDEVTGQYTSQNKG